MKSIRKKSSTIVDQKNPIMGLLRSCFWNCLGFAFKNTGFDDDFVWSMPGKRYSNGRQRIKMWSNATTRPPVRPGRIQHQVLQSVDGEDNYYSNCFSLLWGVLLPSGNGANCGGGWADSTFSGGSHRWWIWRMRKKTNGLNLEQPHEFDKRTDM